MSQNDPAVAYGVRTAATDETAPTGFGVDITNSNGQTVLDITFKRVVGDSIENFVGYDDTTDPTKPTVEFCV